MTEEDRGCTSESIAARLWRNRRLHLLSSRSFTGNSSGLKINQRYRLHRSPPRLPLWPFAASSMAGNLTALPLYGRPLYCAGARMRVCDCVRERAQSLWKQTWFLFAVQTFCPELGHNMDDLRSFKQGGYVVDLIKRNLKRLLGGWRRIENPMIQSLFFQTGIILLQT